MTRTASKKKNQPALDTPISDDVVASDAVRAIHAATASSAALSLATPATTTLETATLLSSSPVAALPPIGFHAPITGGLHNALLKARALDCDAVQIFSRNPRGWTARPLSDEEIVHFHRVRAETKIAPLVIHVNYLVNLAASDPLIRDKSRQAFREEVWRGLALQADYLVVHPGSAKGACEADAVAACAASLQAACAGLELGELRILIENTAGQGACIGHRFEHLRDIIGACPALNLGVCFDTAHAFSAGYDLRDEESFNHTLAALNENVGLENVRVVHFNDSKTDYNSRVDRHWHIGHGSIGRSAMQRIARSAQLAHAAFLLETPQDAPADDAHNLATLRAFINSKSEAAGALTPADT